LRKQVHANAHMHACMQENPQAWSDGVRGGIAAAALHLEGAIARGRLD